MELVNILGPEYIIDHVLSELKAQTEKLALNIYITDALKALVNNSAQEGLKDRSYVHLKMRWLDMIEPQEQTKPIEDNRSCKEIVTNIWNNIRKERR